MARFPQVMAPLFFIDLYLILIFKKIRGLNYDEGKKPNKEDEKRCH